MSVATRERLEALRAAGQVVAAALRAMSHAVRPGVTTAHLTIEPIVSAGSGVVRDGGDGWTVCTADGATSAHAEHTIVITAGAPLVLTPPSS